ncbi:MAG: ABC transporter ATP-binding protein [Candidatus Hydrogenedentes bacterium]|nr:ABC transporter ATP-binding protein [Candidatus Hydrogenedentota bacterium]
MGAESVVADTVVRVESLSRRFGKKIALDNVTLSIPEGCVFGLVGENGAGKTTLIKLLLGLLKPASGTVRVFGSDPVKDPEGVLARIGYLSENREMPDWMRVHEIIRYTRAFYRTWDAKYAAELQAWFRLDPGMRVRNLSRGQRAQLGLLLALAYRPELLLLDEPSSGLDAVVRRDILGAIIRAVAEEGRTVVFSSHLLDEVQRVADVIAMVHEGRVVLCAPMDEIMQRYRKLAVQLPEDMRIPPQLPGASGWEGAGRDWTVLVEDHTPGVDEALAAQGIQIVRDERPSLEDVFVARVRAGRAPRAEV